MITFRMMDEDLFLCKCLHGGPVGKTNLNKPLEKVDGEVVKNVLESVISKYKSCAVLAVDTSIQDSIIGVLWFYPTILKNHLTQNNASFCIQVPEEVEKLSHFRNFIEKAPILEEIPDHARSLDIECMQIYPGGPEHKKLSSSKNEGVYLSKGIGKGMILKLIEWAREQGWREIYATGIPNIKPLRRWVGSYTLEQYQDLGFEVIEGSEEFHPEVIEDVIKMKKGLHGRATKKLWKDYKHLSDQEIGITKRSVYKL